ncbi:MAG: right-handed parallel beta-helix repeat-containing protein [Bacteroidetes bacterium]|nr:right-handed parallel beta-helix repeat-containing protein [Bacteroidota bacterium]
MKSISIQVFILFCFLQFGINSYAQPLSGNYTINQSLPTGGTNFISFTDFAARLSTDGVSGNVTAVVDPANVYTEQVTFHTIPGAGQNATVTLDGNLATIEAITTTTDRHVIRLQDVSWMTIQGLNVNYNAASTGGYYAIHIYDSASHVNIINNNILMGSTSTLHGGIVASGSLTSILDPGNFDHILISNNSIESGGYGVSVYGDANDLATQVEISGNAITDFADNGIYIRETDSIHILGNLLVKNANIISSANAIQIAQNANINAIIEGNSIQINQQNNGSQTIRGIYLFNGTGHKVFNNEVTNVALTSGNFTGIEVRSSATAPEIYFNTISIDDTNSASGNFMGIAEELSNTNSVLRNNLISITKPGTGTRAGLKLGATSTLTTALNSNYNDLWVPVGNVAIKGSSTPVLYPNLSDWQTASAQDANSVSLDPLFSSTFTLHPTNSLLDNLGTPIAGISDDKDGNPRDPITPDIGAYEYFITNISVADVQFQNNTYPNPSRGKFALMTPELATGEICIQLFSASGKLCLEKNTIVNNHQTELTIDNLSPGIYLLSWNWHEKKYFSRIGIVN